MRVLFTTNFPSPYRVSFFNELNKYVELTVAYEREKALHRSKDWVSGEERTFSEVFLKLEPVGTSQSKGGAIVEYLKGNKFDFIVFGGYASPSVMRAILYCRRKKLRYCIEFDGAFNKKDSFINHIVKKELLKKADAFFITCDETRKYIEGFGIDPAKCVKYPFTSLWAEDIFGRPSTEDEKSALKNELGIGEEKCLLSVGQFIPRKGFDVLLNAVSYIDRSVGVYIVGGEPTDEYKSICKANSLDNVHFIGFKSKQELKKIYRAADLFVMPTREDIWGLVINEAMACGLPVVSTDRCNAALELLRSGECGELVPKDDPEKLAEAIMRMLDCDLGSLAENSLKIVSDYTIEKMALRHFEFFESHK